MEVVFWTQLNNFKNPVRAKAPSYMDAKSKSSKKLKI